MMFNEKKRILKNLAAHSIDGEDVSVENDIISKNSRMLTQALNFTDRYENKISESFIDGVEIASNIRSIDPKMFGIFFTEDENNPALQASGDVVYNYKEHWDGSGSPNGLKGEDIPLAARIVAITDAFEMYIKEGLSREEAFHKIETDKGILYDPYLVDLFLKIQKQIKS